jgi:hypothetical protein
MVLHQFLDRHVNIATGRISDRSAFWQLAAMPLCRVIGGTLMLIFAATATQALPDGASGAPAVAAPTAPIAPDPTTVASGGITLHSVNVDFPDSDRNFPGGAEADVINGNCLACHSAGMVLTQPHLSRAQWQAEVDKMRNTYKAPIDAGDVPAIVDYLANLQIGSGHESQR